MSQDLLIHERTYKKRNLASRVHRDKLRVIRKVFRKYVPPSAQSWADFGCSNGFIIESLGKHAGRRFPRVVGYDHKQDLLALARAKNISNAEFKCFDLNEISDAVARFDAVSCFETLEHVANYRAAFVNLYNHVNDGGVLIVTVPNETGLVGLVKFVGRMTVRKKPYEGFFDDRSRIDYVKSLITRESIEHFRRPSPRGYGPHLGFDYRELREFANEGFLAPAKLELTNEFFSGMKTTVVFVFKRSR